MKKAMAIVFVSFVLIISGCKGGSSSQRENPKQSGKEQKMPEVKEPKISSVDPAKKYTAVIKTSKGTITAELFPKEAPLSVTNFKQLADGGYYNGLPFHRVVPGFVIQGGNPTGTGSGGPGYMIPAEIKLPHKKGALAWARTGDAVNPERRSSGSQFYITLEATAQLDGDYTVFGQTISGMDVVEKIQKGDVIESMEVKAE